MTRRTRILPRGWYPVDEKDCRREIESYLRGWTPPPILKGVAGIVPHAGWYFSGKLAARVFSCLKSRGERKIDAVIVYGGHLAPSDLPRIVTEKSWETPLGDVEIHAEAATKLMKRIEMKKESASSGDNTIEVQLAMVKYFFPDSKLLALRSPVSLKAKELGEAVADVAETEGISILAIGSTDLTHYGPNYGFLPQGRGPSAVEWVREENDKGFIDRALRMEIEGLLKHALEYDSACSAGAAASAAATGKALGAEKGLLIGYYTSYDILPDESFVGYAGIVY